MEPDLVCGNGVVNYSYLEFMTATIHKGKHRAWPISFGLLIDNIMERDVVFDSSAAYDLESDDNNDVNKLFGFGYLKGGHHKDSARFGWNYNQQTGRIRIFAYCYINGTRAISQLCEVLPYKKYRLNITITEAAYHFTVHDGFNNWHQVGTGFAIGFLHNKKWKYKLGCYFGGNNKAPHDITIKITRK